MANDIANSVNSTTVINNGSIIVGQAGNPFYQLVDDENPAVNIPTIANIQAKYTDKFDDTTYYS